MRGRPAEGSPRGVGREVGPAGRRAEGAGVRSAANHSTRLHMRTLLRGVLVLALLLVGAGVARAQERVRGRVVSQGDGTPLAGAQVHVPGTGAGVLTNERGEYNLALPAGAKTLSFGYIGYRTLEVPINGRSVIDVAMEATAVNLNALVVVGYTTQQKRSVSDATAGVTAAQLRDVKAATLEEGLRGRIPGVQVIASGEPGRPASIQVRGNAFLGSPSPLYVVDGMYMSENPNLNPDDVESVEVLKDASAAAQYGAQAANGVVVITTKKGRGDTHVELHSYAGVQDIAHRVDMMDASQWAALTRQAYQNAGRTPIAGAVSPQFNTDWQDAVFRQGSLQDHNVTVSGGTPSASYLISGGFTRQEGAIINTNFDRYSFRVNSQGQVGRLTLGENVALSSTKRQGLIGYPLIDVVRFPPAIPVYDSTTLSGYAYGSPAVPTYGTNPVGALNRRSNAGRSNQVIGTAFGELGLLPHLRYRMNLGLNYEDFRRNDFVMSGPLRYLDPVLPANLTDTRQGTTSLLWENLVTFDRTLGEHRVNAVGGYTEQRQNRDWMQAYREGYPDPTLQQIDAGLTSNLNNRGNLTESALRALLFRANYAYADKYLLTGSIRRDGSSRFGASNRYGTFGAASAGWVISKEGFYNQLPIFGTHVDYMKLRASYGVLGNQDIGDYQYAAPIVTNLNYIFAGAVNSGATQLSLANPNIKWQSNKEKNIGLDLGLFEDRLTVTADYYISDSDGLLVSAPIPWSLGASGSPVVNAGSIRNKGFEFGATHHLVRGALQLNTQLNLTTTSNKVLALGNGGQPIFAGPFGVARTAVGSPIGTFWLLQMDGIFQDAQQIASSAQKNAKPGDVRYKDINGDGKITDADRVDSGNGIPKLTSGLFFDGQYKRVDFALNFRGSFGAKVFNVARYWTDRMDDLSNYRAGLTPWTPENHSTTTPRAVVGPDGASNANTNTTRWLESGSYVRVQNLMLGLRLPPSLLTRLGVPDVQPRVYVNVQNLHTFTGFSNWDPETLGFNDPLARGVDDGTIYPNPRTITIGVDLRM